MGILVITTGGTIGALAHEDPQKPPEIVEMPPRGQDLVCRALAEKFAAVKSRCVSLEPRDSKLIDPAYRAEIVRHIEVAPEAGVLITHGTDTILQTAEFLHQQFSVNGRLAGKVVLLTGSMIPLANGPESDGYLNLKFSLEQLSAAGLKKGSLYIVLCDHGPAENEKDLWQPHIYHYQPGQFEKFYAEDARYSHLKRVK